jgi:Pup amidohydrolase
VIVGDANMSPKMTFLKLGATAMVLSMIEDDTLGFSLELDDPVSAMHQVSRDLDLTRKYRLTDGSEITALEIQFKYLEAAQSFAAASDADAMTLEVISLWRWRALGCGTICLGQIANLKPSTCNIQTFARIRALRI